MIWTARRLALLATAICLTALADRLFDAWRTTDNLARHARTRAGSL